MHLKTCALPSHAHFARLSAYATGLRIQTQHRRHPCSRCSKNRLATPTILLRGVEHCVLLLVIAPLQCVFSVIVRACMHSKTHHPQGGFKSHLQRRGVGTSQISFGEARHPGSSAPNTGGEQPPRLPWWGQPDGQRRHAKVPPRATKTWPVWGRFDIASTVS